MSKRIDKLQKRLALIKQLQKKTKFNFSAANKIRILEDKVATLVAEEAELAAVNTPEVVSAIVDQSPEVDEVADEIETLEASITAEDLVGEIPAEPEAMKSKMLQITLGLGAALLIYWFVTRNNAKEEKK